jgi:SAM-dependent methyltransferase
MPSADIRLLAKREPWPSIIRQVKDGIRSRIVGRAKVMPLSQRDNVAKFFGHARGNEVGHDIVDLNSFAYKSMLERLIYDDLFDGKRVLDLGCGSAPILRFMSDHSIKPLRYVGVDLTTDNVVAPIDLAQRSKFINSDVCNIEFEYIDEAEVIVAFNLLCYLERIDELLKLIKSKPGVVLLLAEPSPSIYWESYFSGVHVYLRSKSALRNALVSSGWRPVLGVQTYLFQVAGCSFWQLAWMCRFEAEST